ncbi:hypothetical protein BDZ94DRAFT_1209661 [Collybia nuda]|uniref:Uncharacterized protein n=1 Tax=Collybia nuda TaxID=64659 RepID=A0A9P5YFQ0_9AGAR|nr:hypothetical protein BDZ94DRAFT_1209661 [Collybia nuda]
MSLFANVVGFSLFGLAARFGQLGIQRRNLFDNFGAHLISMGAFGYAGYWAYKWDIRAAELLAEKRAQITERRQKEIKKAETTAAAALGDSE